MSFKSIFLAAILVVGACSAPKAQTLGLEVKTESGPVIGAGDAIRSFKGIPFAATPVGKLRWEPPQPFAHWTSPLDATRFGPDCIQPDEYPELRGNGKSEDCLTVNLWTPARDASEKLPVMVWVYGGGYTYGSGSHPSYDGEALARRGVVLVTFNYRLGLLGFMAHPELTAASPNKASGNYALMDIQAALQWVQRNIGAFGGDPSNVTVFGQSAGAFMISTLMSSQASKGLFQQGHPAKWRRDAPYGKPSGSGEIWLGSKRKPCHPPEHVTGCACCSTKGIGERDSSADGCSRLVANR